MVLLTQFSWKKCTLGECGCDRSSGGNTESGDEERKKQVKGGQPWLSVEKVFRLGGVVLCAAAIILD